MPRKRYKKVQGFFQIGPQIGFFLKENTNTNIVPPARGCLRSEGPVPGGQAGVAGGTLPCHTQEGGTLGCRDQEGM